MVHINIQKDVVMEKEKRYYAYVDGSSRISMESNNKMKCLNFIRSFSRDPNIEYGRIIDRTIIEDKDNDNFILMCDKCDNGPEQFYFSIRTNVGFPNISGKFDRKLYAKKKK